MKAVSLLLLTLLMASCARSPTAPSGGETPAPKGPANIKFELYSWGGDLGGSFHGGAEFHKNGIRFFSGGGGAGGGRGVNIAVIDMKTGELIGQVQNFDPYFLFEQENRRMYDFVQSIPNGALVLAAVGDTASLNYLGLAALWDLGSRMMSQYHFRDGWGMISVKGEGTAREEKLSHDTVTLSITVTVNK